MKERLPLFIFVIIIFILGISFGAITVKTLEYSNRENLFNYFNDFMQEINALEYDQQSLISESIKFNLLNILIIWAFGLSVIIMPLITVLVFFKGFVLGFTAGFLLSQYSYRGILLILSAIFPQNLLIIPGYIFAAVIAIYFSIRIIKFYRGRERLTTIDFIIYSSEMALLAGILFCGSLIETYISPFLFRFVLRFI
jgi:stage II sporulation protein M